MHHISSVADWYFWLYELFCDEGVDEKLKINFELHQISMAHFVDLNEINKKVIEGNLPGSLLCGIRGTQRSKIAQNSSKIGLNLNSRKHTVSIPYFEDLVETNKKVMRATFQDHTLGILGAPKGLK
jgi:hypothetical protein